ncbi:uncharacterized protein DS421_11g332440 [Arachis hypogaea]|nr:uncharacterized protein DS421_11g332440 [Arachis hypogaea]
MFVCCVTQQVAIGRDPIPQASISAIIKDFMGYVDEILTPKDRFIAPCGVITIGFLSSLTSHDGSWFILTHRGPA